MLLELLTVSPPIIKDLLLYSSTSSAHGYEYPSSQSQSFKIEGKIGMVSTDIRALMLSKIPSNKKMFSNLNVNDFFLIVQFSRCLCVVLVKFNESYILFEEELEF